MHSDEKNEKKGARGQAWLMVEPDEYRASNKPPVCLPVMPNQWYPVMFIIHRIAKEKQVDLFHVHLKLARFDSDDMGLRDDDQFRLDSHGNLSFQFAKHYRWWTMGSAAARYDEMSSGRGRGHASALRSGHGPRIMYTVRRNDWKDNDIKRAIHDSVNPKCKRPFSEMGLEWLRKNDPELKRPCTVKLVVSTTFKNTNWGVISWDERDRFTDETCVIDTIAPWRQALFRAIFSTVHACLPEPIWRLVFHLAGVGPFVPTSATHYDEWDKERKTPKTTCLEEFDSSAGQHGEYVTTMKEWDAWMNYVYNGFELHVTLPTGTGTGTA